MKQYFFLFTAAILLFSNSDIRAQDLNFRDSTYYYRGQNDTLVSSGKNLGQFDFSSANRTTDTLFLDGIYFPAIDCFGNNLWIRLRHVAEDPNGNSKGVDVPATTGNPCQSPTMIGGWAGFLYDIEIHRDLNLTGVRTNHLGALFPTSITVASLEYLGGPCNYNEWLSFVIVNSSSTGWSLNSVNFTGINPQSSPVYSDTLSASTLGGCYPPIGFSYTFPTGSDSISATSGDSAGSGLSEFKMSAGSVSHFQYGYEYTGLSGGYQGMSMAFGSAPTFNVTAQDISCKNGIDGQLNVGISGGIGPFTYQWSNSITTGSSLTGLSSGTYVVTVTDQNGCGTIAPATVTINEPTGVTVMLDSLHITHVKCHNGIDGSIQLYPSGSGSITYLWNTSSTIDTISGLSAGIYTVTISDQNSCLVAHATISEPVAINVSTTVNGNTITANETGATFQWINCNGNTVIIDSTFESITPSVTGNYKVAITKNGCSDISACVNITVGGIADVTALTVSVYPNPTNGLVTLAFTRHAGNARVKLINLVGQTEIERTGIQGSMSTIDITECANGIYILELSEDGNVSRVKIVKN